MKDTDILNIRRILEYRKNKPYFKDGGDLSFEEINSRSTEELEDLLTTNNQSVIPEIKALVDQIFQKFSDDPEDNMIALWAAHYDEHDVYDQGCPMTSISFDGFSHRHNKFYYPIGSAWDFDDVPKEYRNLTPFRDSRYTFSFLLGTVFGFSPFTVSNLFPRSHPTFIGSHSYSL